MEIILNGKASAERSVLALGMFDGMHIGHQVLLERAAVLAQREGCPLVVCTFQRHPMEFLCPEKAPRLLNTLQERQQLIQNLGADLFFAMPFDRDLAEMPPECYVGELVRRFHPKAVVCGFNHRFGKGGTGSTALLEVLGGALGFETSIVPQITLKGQAVSASDIRKALMDGRVEAAAAMLGRPYGRKGLLLPDGGFSFADKEKQPVADGSYCGRLTFAGKKYPVIFRQRGEEASVNLSAIKGQSGEVIVEYISRKK